MLAKSTPATADANKIYRVIAFSGLANGTPLAAQFDMNIIRKRYIELKSFRVVPYYPPGLAPGVDIFLDDGVTQTIETIQPLQRIDRLFDDAAFGTQINLAINGFNVLFDSLVGMPFSLDTVLDNIGYKYPERVSDIALSINSLITLNLQTAAQAVPHVKVIIECYLS